MRQFDIVNIALDPARGSEQRGTRPCVLLQTNAAPETCRTTVIAPLSTQKTDRIYPYEILVRPSKKNGLTVVSKLKLDQIRVVAAERIRGERGHLEAEYVPHILLALDALFDREQMFAENTKGK